MRIEVDFTISSIEIVGERVIVKGRITQGELSSPFQYILRETEDLKLHISMFREKVNKELKG